jgi:hypothetical protein
LRDYLKEKVAFRIARVTASLVSNKGSWFFDDSLTNAFIEIFLDWVRVPRAGRLTHIRKIQLSWDLKYIVGA